ncbi:MAG: acyl-CoA dehydrogenase [Rhodobacter sp. BACL10 MAG-121220-bin24]|jgi:acyl-CoA dehydrogenase|nr:MAG: acyl-CoA dehydrogenase [Rhodobacter sp. BACL10 MAG-120910-bin24]KRO91046.1 MAG: acyl-CoA dehydrogenase [Rhodobacter sp. BACL10 MAG-121220-bin24]KRP25364.1 MAG: acyl-CoA dehydrogenase [Rhodobacter sp. BACL10 MAG-120419-bin15]|tara:strand:+ start:13111 stop:14271 length:1161 start_codon:yes stop_codon:yes gene_type:complete
MTYNLDHENELLISTVKAFMEKEIFPHEDFVDKSGVVPDDLGRQIEKKAKEAGLYSANMPENIGGGGLSKKAISLIEREYGKTSHALHSWIGRPTEILLACVGDQISNYLQPCVTGEKRELFALSEPGAGSDVMGMKSNARRDGADWILNGSKHFISGPCMPDFAIVFAVTGLDDTKRGPRKRITAFLVDVGTRGFEISEGNKSVSYRGYKTFQLSFNDVRLGPDQVLGEEGNGLELAGKWLGMGRIWVGACCCGKAERIIGLANEWSSSRIQFGKPIGQFQATGFKLADMAIGLRTADLLVSDAVRRAEDGVMTDADAAMVKVYCSEMLGRVADDCVQIYGGMGLMEELPIQRLWRDSRLERIWDGTSEIQRHIIARSILRPLGA